MIAWRSRRSHAGRAGCAADGIASTALTLGNAIGLAVFTVIAGLGTEGRTGQALRVARAGGELLVVLLTAAGMIAGSLITLVLPYRGQGASR
ncbi:hypothetical protein [Nonomuraea sp. NPDC005501]|uniref:hypothetical protein n=1 Tax=Nonomuraea sp. NPDC005501 TaxID=3156884 RepID=UPI0033A19291